MKQNAVILKSNAYGLILFLDPQMPFEQLQHEVADKFREAARFFRNAQMALTFKGRDLSDEEERQLIETITENSRIHIVCLVDEDPSHSDAYRDAVMRSTAVEQEGKAALYSHTLTSGQSLETDGNLVILGDVNPGAAVTAGGNVIIMGCCMGSVTAGFGGKGNAFVCALVLKPSFLKIADLAARPAISKKTDTGEYKNEPKIAWLKNGHLVIETVRGNIFEKLMSFSGTDQQE